MPVTTELQHALLIARLSGEIDHHQAKGLRDTIDKAVYRSGAKGLELDFRDVTFMDSSGIGLVMGRYTLMRDLGGRLYVTNVAGGFKKVMVLAGLDRLCVLENPPESLLYPPTKVGEKDGKEAGLHESQQQYASGV